jgi:hypothetical protein
MSTTAMKRPVGIVVLSVLCFFVGGSGLLMNMRRPIVFLGMFHTGISAMVLHLAPSLFGVYIGYGLLKPFRHIWFAYIVGACLSIAGLICNLMHDAKIWEWHLHVGSQTASIPRLVKFTLETHYLLIAIYALTAMYVYLHKPYFWGQHDV